MNYLTDVPNPFGLAGPPAFFLHDLAIFDADLVLFPSQEEAIYRLGRKVTHAPDIWRLVASVQNGRKPDARTMARHGLVPVTSILPSPLTHWGPTILQDLAQMDVQRFGGADKFVDAIEDREEAEAAHTRATEQADLDALAHEAYSDVVWQAGRRVGMTSTPPVAS